MFVKPIVDGPQVFPFFELLSNHRRQQVLKCQKYIHISDTLHKVSLNDKNIQTGGLHIQQCLGLTRHCYDHLYPLISLRIL